MNIVTQFLLQHNFTGSKRSAWHTTVVTAPCNILLQDQCIRMFRSALPDCSVRCITYILNYMSIPVPNMFGPRIIRFHIILLPYTSSFSNLFKKKTKKWRRSPKKTYPPRYVLKKSDLGGKLHRWELRLQFIPCHTWL